MRNKRTCVGLVGVGAAAMIMGGLAFFQPVSAQNRDALWPNAWPRDRYDRPLPNQPHYRRHRYLYDALRHLQEAERALERGPRDYGGNRQQALEYTRRALREVRQAIAYHDRNDRR